MLWRVELQAMLTQAKRLTLQGESVPRYISTRAEDYPSILSARQLKNVHEQAKYMHKAWEGQAVAAYRNMVSASSLNGFDRLVQYRLNAHRAWYASSLELEWLTDGVAYWHPKDDEAPEDARLVKIAVTTDQFKLARWIMKRVWRNKAGWPQARNVKTMIMNTIVCSISEAKDSTEFPYWACIATLTKRKPVRIPLRENPYAEGQLASRDGERKGIMQVRVDGGELTIKRVIAYDDAPLADGNLPVCGFDQGASHALFITSDGEHHGQAFLAWLRGRDQEAIALERELAQRKIKPSASKRYQRLVKRIRDHTVNEINRILNKLASRYGHLVLEKLDFRNQRLSPTINRLLTRLGRSQLQLKLKMLTEDRGTRVSHVTAIYSSQECSRCGLVRAANRQGKTYSCVFCGHVAHADVNAGQVIRDRRSIPLMITSDYACGRNAVLAYLDKRFLARWGLKALAGCVSDTRYAQAVGLVSAGGPIGPLALQANR